MLTTVAGTTVIDVLSQTLPTHALRLAAPAATPVAIPEKLMLATELLSEPQETPFVRSWLEPSLNVPVAVNCWNPPTGKVGRYGEIVMELSVAEVTCREAVAFMPLKLAEMVVLPVLIV